MSRAQALMALLAVAPVGCADRAIRLAACEDGRLEPGDVCMPEVGDVRRADFEPLAMQVADFDGDTHLDVLMLGVEEWTLRSVLLPGDGSGELGEGRDSHVQGCSAYPIPGDIDGDAAADLLVAECGPSMLVLSGGPDGFDAGRSVPTGGVPRTSSIDDVDGDGTSDVVVLATDEAGLATMNVALADGQGGFSAPVISAVAAALDDFDPFGFGLGDFDEDGTVDAVFIDASETTGRVAIARGRGDGRFESPEGVPVDVSPAGAWLRDFDGDDHLDLLVLDRATSELTLLRGDGTGALDAATRTPREDADAISGSAIGDLDGDGRDDLVFAFRDETSLEIVLGERDGGFEDPLDVEGGGESQQIAIADLDEDGALDLVVGTFADGGIRVILARP